MKLPFTFEKKQDFFSEQQSEEEYTNSGVGGCETFCDNQSIRGLSDLYSPQEPHEQESYEKDGELSTGDVADILLDMGRITSEQLAQVRKELSANSADDIETILLKDGLVNSDDILEARAQLYGFEFRAIKPEEADREAFGKLSIDFIKNNSICPVAIEEETLVVATSEPANVFAIEDVKRQTQMDVKVVVCSAEEIEAVCDLFGEEKIDYNFDDIISDMTDVEVVQDQEKDFEDLEKMAGQSPVIKFVNYLISNAIKEGASDIHIEPKDKFMKVRYRIDGVLFETMQPPLKMHPAIVSRIKIMSNLDISERRLPQDGKFRSLSAAEGLT